jgi:hypothetical protein
MAMRHLLDAMRLEGMQGRVESAFRAFGTQCWVFGGWAQKAHGGLLRGDDAERAPGAQSAPAGHDGRHVHERLGLLGACLPRRLRLHAGRTLARRERVALWLRRLVPHRPRRPEGRLALRPALGPPGADRPEDRLQERALARALPRGERRRRLPRGVARERPRVARGDHAGAVAAGERGLLGDAELPVCDGCECGACATLAEDGDRTPCGEASLRLEANGRVVAPAEEPGILEASAKGGGGRAPRGGARPRAGAHADADAGDPRGGAHLRGRRERSRRSCRIRGPEAPPLCGAPGRVARRRRAAAGVEHAVAVARVAREGGARGRRGTAPTWSCRRPRAMRRSACASSRMPRWTRCVSRCSATARSTGPARSPSPGRRRGAVPWGR